MGWPRVVTGAAARILSMVMDIARTSVQLSGRVDIKSRAVTRREEQWIKDDRGIRSLSRWSWLPLFYKCIELPCHLPPGQCWRGRTPHA